MPGTTGRYGRTCGEPGAGWADRDHAPCMSALTITRRGVVVPRPPDAAGVAGPTPGQARGPRWRRVAPGHYVPADTDSSTRDQRIVEAMAGLPPDAAVTGWASLGWRRARWFEGLAPDGLTPLDVPVALDRRRGVRRRVGVELTEDWLLPGDVVDVDGLRTTIPARAVAFEACRARSLAAAVATVDMAAAADCIDLEGLGDYAAGLGPRPGIRRFREALSRADENAWSPQESRMRLVWTDLRPGIVLAANRPVFDHAGRHLMTPDLLDERAGIVGEYDGAVHLEDPTRRRDLDREALCRDLGLELVTMMSSSRADAASFTARLGAAYRRSIARSGRRRAWTTEQPTWWVDTSTVARRRALPDTDRALWLRRLAG